MNYNTPEACPCACCAEYACHCKDYPEAKRCDCFLCRCALGLDRPIPNDEVVELKDGDRFNLLEL